MRGLGWGVGATNLLQLVNEVDRVGLDFLIGVVKPSLNDLVHNMIIAYCIEGSDQWGRIAGKSAPLTPVGDHGLGLLDLRCPNGKAPNISGS
jgi:hypothetical protein